MKKIYFSGLIFVFSFLTFAQVSINSTTFSYSQDFNSLALSGTGNTWNDNSTITGWYSNRGSYDAGNGSSNTGSLYSFGAASSSERALGSVASNSTGSIIYGVRFVNNSGITITQIPIRYTGEQWRDAGNTTQHSLLFSYQIDATGLTSGTWTSVSQLDFTGPIATATAGELDGNSPSNRETLSFTISLTLNNGQEIWFRLEDVNNSGADHGLSIDDFEFNPNGDPLPVELSSFSAIVLENAVKLNWRTETEVNNYGFKIERASSSTTPVQEWDKIGFVEGHGNSNSPKDYSFTDNLTHTLSLNLTPTLRYRLKQIDNDGKFEYSKVIEVNLGTPKKFELSQNYPNPFNPVTTIKFSLAEASNVKLKVFNILGEEMKTLVDGFKEAGIHTINFDASELNSGLYFYRLEARDFVQSRKMLLVK